MSAYANRAPGMERLHVAPIEPAHEHSELLDLLVDQLATRVADRVVSRLADTSRTQPDQWLDSSAAAAYLSVSRHTIRRLAAEGSLPTEQAGANCKLYFRRSELDSWRRGAAKPGHLRSVA